MTDEKNKESCDKVENDEETCSKFKEYELAGPQKVTEEPESSDMKSGQNGQKTEADEKDEGGKPTEGKGVGTMTEENAIKEEAKAAKKEMAKADDDCACGTAKDDENPAKKDS